MSANRLEELWPGNSKWLILAFLIAFFWILKIAVVPTEVNINNIPADNIDNKATTLAKNINLTKEQSLSWLINGDKSENAPTIIQYTDFTCIHCFNSRNAINYIRTNHPKIRLILHDRTPNERSLNLAISANCAGEQGKYWEVYNAYFDKQSSTFGDNLEELARIAKNLGVNIATFVDCVNNKKYLEQIKKDMQNQETLGIDSTPTWFINNEKITGEMTNFEAENIIKTISK